MGISDSRTKKHEKKLLISSKIAQEFNCPLCNKKFTGKTTFIQLNKHLKKCDKTQKNLKSTKRIGLSFDDNTNQISNEIKGSIRKYRKHSSVILKEISKNMKIDNFFMKENSSGKFSKNEQEGKNYDKKIIGSLEDRLNQMNEYFCLKKNQNKNEIIIKGENIFQLFNKLKQCNIYEKIAFFLQTNEIEKKIEINELIFQYFDLMIKEKNIEIINGKTILLSFDNNIDFELFGYILAILLIYPNCRINYKLPKLICKLLINEKICLNDIQYENKSIYDFLTEIKNKNDFSNLNLYFYYERNYLIPNGNKIKVDEYNLEEYINKMVEFEINKHIKKIDIIKDSMFRYVPKNYIMNFKGEELYQIFNRLL